jgi:hypothetical protein
MFILSFLLTFTLADYAGYNITDRIVTVESDNVAQMTKTLTSIICKDKANFLNCSTIVTDLHDNPLSPQTGIGRFNL